MNRCVSRQPPVPDRPAILCTLLFVLLFAASLPGQFYWNPLPNAPRSWRLDDMYFLTPERGWAINPNYSYLTPQQRARVLGTTDGGQTWEVLLDSSQTFIRSIGFADSLTGWFGNLGEYTPDSNFMYQTVDGGHNWTPVTNVVGPRPGGICGISVVTDSVIYGYGRYSGPPVMVKTSDKGQTWNSQALDSLAAGLIDGWWFGPDTGFVVGSAGAPKQALVLGTVDGGASWQVRHMSPRADETCWKVFFPSRNVGYASIQSHLEQISSVPPDTSWILKTTDGGITWTDKTMRTDGFFEIQGIGFINDQVGWLGGDCCQNRNYKTTDGGDTWSIDPSFGVQMPPYSSYGGYTLNRFRKFGDSLMYAAGNTVYRMTLYPVVGTADAQPSMAVQLHPNPTQGHTELGFTPSPPFVNAELDIWDALGRRVVGGLLVEDAKARIPIPALPRGIYTYRLREGEAVLGTGKLWVNE